MTALDNVERLVAVEQRSKSNTHRIENLEENNKALNDLAKAMGIMAERTDNIDKTVNKLDSRLETIEKKPSARLEQIISAVLVAIIGLTVGYLFGGVM